MFENNGMKELTTEEAKLILSKHAADQIQSCAKDIKEVLEKHGCRFDISVVIREDKVIPQLAIVPVKE